MTRRIASHLLARLSACAAAAVLLSSALAHAAFIPGPRSVAAFVSYDDHVAHAIIARDSGVIVDVGGGTAGSAKLLELGRFNDVVAVAGYYAPADQFRHAIVATRSGELIDIRYKPQVAPAAIRLTNLHDSGNVVSLAAWVDAPGNQNIAILTTWIEKPIVQLFRRAPNSPGKLIFLELFPFTTQIADVAGNFEHWNQSNQIQLAFGAPGQPTTLRMISWPANIEPDAGNITDQFGGSTAWVTNFPGRESPRESVLSLSSGDGTFGDHPAFGSVLQIAFLDANNSMKLFSVNSGGGLITGAKQFANGVGARSIAGPFYTGDGPGWGSAPLTIHVIVAFEGGRLFSLTAEPPLGQGPLVWTTTLLGTF